MAVPPSYITTLQIQAFHWLANTSQSVAHSQISYKASPLRLDFDPSSSIVQTLEESKLTVVILRKIKKSAQEKI